MIENMASYEKKPFFRFLMLSNKLKRERLKNSHSNALTFITRFRLSLRYKRSCFCCSTCSVSQRSALLLWCPPSLPSWSSPLFLSWSSWWVNTNCRVAYKVSCNPCHSTLQINDWEHYLIIIKTIRPLWFWF